MMIDRDIPVTYSGFCIKLRLNDKKIFDPVFFNYLFKTRQFKKSMTGTAVGANIQNLSQSRLGSCEVNVPDIEIQKEIATILSRYDSLIENYQKQIKLLEEAAQRLYKEWFVDLHFPGHEDTKIVDGVPEGWEKKKLVDMVDVQYGYAFDGKLFNSNSEGMPILRIRNIPDGITSDYTTEEAQDCYIVHNGDIVVGMDGIFHINSWSGGDAYLVQRACSFRPKEEYMKGFNFQAIQEPIKFFEKTLVGATVAHLGKKHIDSIELCIPKNFELYKPFSKFYNQRQGLLSQIRLLTEARDRLLPKLMDGEIKV
jgi:type I restriction enzyme S subunit